MRLEALALKSCVLSHLPWNKVRFGSLDVSHVLLGMGRDTRAWWHVQHYTRAQRSANRVHSLASFGANHSSNQPLTFFTL